MPRAQRSGVPFNLYLPPEVKAELEALAGRNGRSLHDEIRHAVARHLAAPPVLESPPLDAPTEAPPARARGRKKGEDVSGAQKSPR